MSDLDLDRLADVVTELTDTLDRLTKFLDDPEHKRLLNSLTDERFRTVTR